MESPYIVTSSRTYGDMKQKREDTIQNTRGIIKQRSQGGGKNAHHRTDGASTESGAHSTWDERQTRPTPNLCQSEHALQ